MTDSTANLAHLHRELINRLKMITAEGAVLVLVAPLQSGKTTATSTALRYIFNENETTKVLLLAPHRSILEQWALILSQGGVPAATLDEPRLRSLYEDDQLQGIPWPPGVACTTTAVATNPSSQKMLSRIRWDLIIMDGSTSHDEQRGRFEELISAEYLNGAKFLILSSAQANWGDRLSNHQLLDWSSIVSSWAQQNSHAIVRNFARVIPIEYMPTTQEAKLWDIAANSVPPPAAGFSSALRSSVAAAEELLLQNMDTPTPDNIISNVLLEAIDDIESDSRLDATTQIIDEMLRSDRRKIVMFCAFRSTAEYLHAALSERCNTTFWLAHASLVSGECSKILMEFRQQNEGILILTDDVVAGINLQGDAAIHYDIPPERNSLRERGRSFFPMRNTEYSDHYVLTDTSGSIPGDTDGVNHMSTILNHSMPFIIRRSDFKYHSS